MTTENQNTQSKPATQALSDPAGSEFYDVLCKNSDVRNMLRGGESKENVIVYLARKKEKLEIAQIALNEIADKRNLGLAMPSETVKLLVGRAGAALADMAKTEILECRKCGGTGTYPYDDELETCRECEGMGIQNND